MTREILGVGFDTASRNWSRPDPKTQRLAERLSKREKQVLRLLIGGYTSREVALRLNISVRTVEIYRILINQKLDEPNSSFTFATDVAFDWSSLAACRPLTKPRPSRSHRGN
ncbi:MAG: helix-turn-helix transcriptional regulator [Erythrobacter sp.]|uniref:helix-turn-helix transcriptional regulator n=1 Tax=Erythrobacter sp. TaxID=1042 RepID=UPI001B2B3995|nr:helix-turn-helix transcriptional regulator [Erythrobacter sp.]MBO6768279.1 helix-turn-helix transcriptional regulator [Erythrobacter sp.]